MTNMQRALTIDETIALIQENERLREALEAIHANAKMIVDTQHTMHDRHRALVQMIADRCYVTLELGL